jgi:hypothetical protein
MSEIIVQKKILAVFDGDDDDDDDHKFKSSKAHLYHHISVKIHNFLLP